jgi:SWI/SNF-related matrix-associated actin-dependent regulator 1 of chromatin subfamily A
MTETSLLDPLSWVRPSILKKAQEVFSFMPGGQPASAEDLLAILVLAAHADEAAIVRKHRLGLGSIVFSEQRRAQLLRHLAAVYHVDPDAMPLQDIHARAMALWQQTWELRRTQEEENARIASRLRALLPEGLVPDPHQVDAVRFFEEQSHRILLADDMGLGKTVVALCSILFHLRDAFPVLVLCPLSMPYTWEREARKWLSVALARMKLPSLEVAVLTSTRDVEYLLPKAQANGRSLFMVMSYDQASLHQRTLLFSRPRFLIADESHYLKNFESQRTRAVLKIRTPTAYRMLLSGTPMPNGRPKEIFPQIRILDPQAFEDTLGKDRTMKNFLFHFCGPTFLKLQGRKVTTFNGRSHMDELGIVLAPYMLRRTKAEVGMKLGEKTRYRIDIRLDAQEEQDIEHLRAEVAEHVHQRFEEEVCRLVERGASREAAEGRVQSLLSSEVMEQLSVVRMAVGKIKARRSVDLVRDLIEDDHRVIVFTAHHEVANAAARAYVDAFGSDRVAQCFSSVIGKQRDDALGKAIQSGASVLVLPRAYREGLTMIEFDRMVMLERWWISGEESQAEDRIHRRGQDKPVAIYYPHACNTTDDAMAELLTWKEQGQQMVQGASEKRLFEWLLRPGEQLTSPQVVEERDFDIDDLEEMTHARG